MPLRLGFVAIGAAALQCNSRYVAAAAFKLLIAEVPRRIGEVR